MLYAMKTSGEWMFLTSTLVAGVQLNAPVALTLRWAHGTDWIGGCVGPRIDLDDVEKRASLTQQGLEIRPFSRPAFSHIPTPLLRIVEMF